MRYQVRRVEYGFSVIQKIGVSACNSGRRCAL
nr:MAG TPA: hypothetical protein [Caudoviricetes sp.]